MSLLIMIHITSTFHAFSAGALLLLGTLIILGVNRTNVHADRWLSTFYYLTAAMFTQLFLEGFRVDYKILLHLLELPRWTILPCLYMAIHYMVRPSAAVKHWILHFIPFLAFLLLSVIYLMPAFFNADINPPQLPQGLVFIIKYFFFAQCIFYWIACFRLLNRHHKNIQQLSSYSEKINMIWLKYLLIAVLFLIIVRLLAFIHLAFTFTSPILYFIGTLALAYATLTQRSIYTVESEENLMFETRNKKDKTEERLTPQQVEVLKNKLVQKTTNERLYLDPSLTLSTLANQIGINPHDLSYIINNGLEKNFYQFINELRTEEAKKLLVSEKAKQLDMFGIAIQAGFNSRTTFYSNFKKITGVTPTEYIKIHNSNNSS
ncbi:helix-turn-helix domain-containing protein [Sphingobacterium spiritivorum]|uniref:helix-turn-helix domain-containing protein n=1 Tax=Sphingobacterium spiritivorum TaxID=258 RepID=UPI001918E3F6|nr:helix-turn-helix domain-containing protein [Sphingobacterium spiritivorum]QQT24568.1 helix-turn-helix domain-containing protein [Sphingobacterium spiritivorum]